MFTAFIWKSLYSWQHNYSLAKFIRAFIVLFYAPSETTISWRRRAPPLKSWFRFPVSSIAEVPVWPLVGSVRTAVCDCRDLFGPLMETCVGSRGISGCVSSFRSRGCSECNLTLAYRSVGCGGDCRRVGPVRVSPASSNDTEREKLFPCLLLTTRRFPHRLHQLLSSRIVVLCDLPGLSHPSGCVLKYLGASSYGQPEVLSFLERYYRHLSNDHRKFLNGPKKCRMQSL